jgi:hypothetical protein
MDQFLTGDIWGKVNKLITGKTKKIACIAYVTSEKLYLSKGDVLVCDASEFAIKFGQTSAVTLQNYFNRGIAIYSNSQLHAKLLLTETFLVIGSANLSKSSAEKLTESSVLIYNKILLRQAKAFCFNLRNESGLLTQVDIDELLKIKVVKRPHKPFSKSKTRGKTFGNTCWYLSAYPLKERTYEKIRDKVEGTAELIAKRENIHEDNIGFIRWSTTSQFGKNAKEGDQIILRFHNESQTQSHIFPPSVILGKEKVNGYYHFHHDVSDAEERKLSWTKFLKISNGLGVDLGKRSKTVSSEILDKLNLVWPHKTD